MQSSVTGDYVPTYFSNSLLVMTVKFYVHGIEIIIIIIRVKELALRVIKYISNNCITMFGVINTLISSAVFYSRFKC